MNRQGPLGFFRQSLKSESYHADELVNIYLLRPVAACIVWLVRPFPVTPNMLTLTAVLIGCASGWCYGYGSGEMTVVAGGLILLKDIIDDADGQLARAKQLYSRRGRFLDSIGDFVVDVAVFSGITVAVWSALSFPGALLLGAAGLAGITLRVSYHVFYQVSFLHTENVYSMNRIVEEVGEEERTLDPVAYRLGRIFGVIYTWQDRFMFRLDRRCMAGRVDDARLQAWYADRIGLRLSGFLGFGTEISLLAVCSWFDEIPLYLWLNLILMNGIWLVSVLYRRWYLAPNLMQ